MRSPLETLIPPRGDVSSCVLTSPMRVGAADITVLIMAPKSVEGGPRIDWVRVLDPASCRVHAAGALRHVRR